MHFDDLIYIMHCEITIIINLINILIIYIIYICFAYGLAVKNLPAMQETQEIWFLSLGREDPLEEEMSTHPRILAWKIPWTGIWRATVQRVAKSQTQLSTHIYNINKYIYIFIYLFFLHENTYCLSSRQISSVQ